MGDSTMSTLFADSILPLSYPATYIPGHIVQVKTITINEMTSWSSPVSSNTIITPLTISITPKFSNSKIIVQWMINGEVHHDNVFRIFKNNSLAPNGLNTYQPSARWSGFVAAYYDNDYGSTPSNYFLQYIDSPNSTSQQNYQVAVGGSGATAYTFFLNRTASSTGQDSYEVCVSTGVAWEICQ